MYDTGDSTPVLQITVKDTLDAVTSGGTVVCTITAPDGTTSTPSVSNPSTGVYEATPVTTTAGRYGVRWTVTLPSANAVTDVYDVADPAMLPIVSLADLKTHLSLTGTTTEDESLRRVLATATELAERYCNRALRRKTVVETHDGYGRGITLRQAPVISVTTVVENGTTLTAADYTVNTMAGLLYRGSATSTQDWYDGLQSVVVTYVAGYTSPPLVAQRAVLDIAKWLHGTTEGVRPAFGDSVDGGGLGNDALPTWLYRPLESLRMPGIA